MRTILLVTLFATLWACSHPTETAASANASSPQEASAPVAITSADNAIVDLAEQAVPQFHMAINGGRFDAIYEGAAQDLKLAQSQTSFVTYLQKLHAKMGDVQGANRTSSSIAGDLVTLRYDSKYAKGDANEELVVRLQGQAATLVSYRMLSPSLP